MMSLLGQNEEVRIVLKNKYGRKRRRFAAAENYYVSNS
jgi:hypothetical protein